MTDIETPVTPDLAHRTTPDRFGNVRIGEFLTSKFGADTLSRLALTPQWLQQRATHMISMLDADYRITSTSQDGMDIAQYEVGEYSRLFLVTIGEDRFIAKIPAQKHDTPHEPYTQHMKQKQAITQDIGAVLRDRHITLPTPLFASDSFYLEEFTDGVLPPLDNDTSARSALDFARHTLMQYLQSASLNEPEIWDNTGVEFVPPFERIHTMRIRPDGSFSWVAPVYAKSVRT